MEWEVQQIVIALLGGGGITALATKLWQIVKEHKQGKLDIEDTAIARWQAIAEEREEEVHEMQWELNWYRANYAAIRAEWLTMPPEDASQFPAIPPPLQKRSS